MQPARERGEPPPSPTSTAGMASRLQENLLHSVLSSTLGITESSDNLLQGSAHSRKQPLSLQVTTSNFKRFVAKSGPIFWISDQLEAVVTWDDPIRTLFWAAVWGIVSYYPMLLALVPHIVLLVVLLNTYAVAHPNDDNLDGLKARPDIHASQLNQVPEAGSVDYLENLQSIQTIMGRIAAFTDLGRALVPYLNWSARPRLTLAICQITLLSFFSTFLLLPVISWRIVMFLVGEAVFVIGHPSVQRILRRATHQVDATEYEALAQRCIRVDSLPDLALEVRIQMKEVVVWEEESINPDGTVAYHRCVPPVSDHEVDVKPRERPPPEGWLWLEEDWTIDRTWSAQPFSKDGWATEVLAVPQDKKGKPAAKLRKRRWMRKSFRFPS